MIYFGQKWIFINQWSKLIQYSLVYILQWDGEPVGLSQVGQPFENCQGQGPGYSLLGALLQQISQICD